MVDEKDSGFFERLNASVAREHLAVFGVCDVRATDNLPAWAVCVVLLGPKEPGFWDHVTAQPEFADSLPDPLDRWSMRAVGAIAQEFNGLARFPFGGPPFLPFQDWALRSGRAWRSPVGLLVHDTAGLMVSFRGALALAAQPPKAGTDTSPCDTCADTPCTTACPPGALTTSGYDVPACRDFLRTSAGTDCMTRGCRARRACPVSATYPRLAMQSAFHMRNFLR